MKQIKAEKETEWIEYYTNTYPEIWKQRVKHYGFTEYHRNVISIMNVQSDEMVLECGIGTGYPLAINNAMNNANIYGIDLSLFLLQDCKNNFQNSKKKCFLAQSKADKLPFANSVFDRVYCISTTWYLLDLKKFLEEVLRVTKPGGTIYFDILNGIHVTHFIGRIYNFFRNSSIVQKIKPSNSLHLYRTPFKINNILNKLQLEYRVKGFFVLLPTGLPLIGDKADICKYFSVFSFGMQDSFLRYFGAKLLYICKKN